MQVPLLQEILDGPNVNMFRVSQQLGQLSSYADADVRWPQSEEAAQRVPSLQGMHIDFFAASGSLILLAVLLAISFDRILGLDRIFAEWFTAVRRRSKARQLADLDATKQRLEQLLQDGSMDET